MIVPDIIERPAERLIDVFIGGDDSGLLSVAPCEVLGGDDSYMRNTSGGIAL